MRRTALALFPLALGLAASTAGAQRGDDDDYTAPRNATVDAAGARLIRVDARAGELRVTGVEGLREVRIRGTARASDRDDLDDIRLTAERRGDVVEVRVDIPDGHRVVHFGRHVRALDLAIEVPKGAAMEVDDSSGAMELRGVGGVRIKDSSGDIEVLAAGGPVWIDDRSGSIRVEQVRGDVEIADSSGEIELRRITGNVIVDEDSSGEIFAADVSGRVHVRDDSSGGITVRDVGGDFIVDRDGSGGIDHRNVKGEVRVPERRHSRRDRDRRW